MTASAPDDPLASALQRALEGAFTLSREIGRGGMGVVYLAHDLRLDRPVAIKVLPTDQGRDPLTRERFLREARTAASLAHPNIVAVYRADEVDGLALFVMAYVDGESLAERVRARGPLPAEEAVRFLREAAWALAYAHARGVVHRDVKPENILVERASGRALVTDFGIARRSDDGAARSNLTQPQALLGTLHYMSPEQVNGGALDGRSDLYALGVVAYHLLSGRLPFDDVEGPAVLVAHVTRPAPPLATVAPHVPAPLADVVDRCLAKRPDDRFATGEDFADALEAALAAAPAQAAGTYGLPATLTEDDAARIWRRAAQLQADAVRRLEEHPELLTRGHERADAADPDPAHESGTRYAIAHVVAAAQEAGISQQYVRMAIAELPRAPRAENSTALVTLGAEPLGVSERQATLFLGTPERSLAVTHVVPADPARTLRILGVVLQRSPYDLQLRDTIGAHPLDGGVIVFDLPGAIVGAGGASAASLNTSWMGTHQQLEARQLQVTLRAVPGAPRRTEVTITCDLRPGVRSNVRVSQWLGATLGTVVGGGTGAILAKGAAVVLSAAVLAPTLVAGAGVAALSLWGYRRLYPSVVRKATKEMLAALEAVSAAVRSEEIFGTLPEPRRPSLGGDDGGAAAAIITMAS